METRVNVDSVIDRFYSHFTRDVENDFVDNHCNKRDLIDSIASQLRIVFASSSFLHEYVEERIQKIEEYKQVLKQLLSFPLVEQRSKEWYELRKNRITASDFAQALGQGKFGTQKQFYQKKCGYEEHTFDDSNPALKWGVMYEPVAVDAYASRNKVKTHEFGLLVHPTETWFGASPDSVSELGIMVEIKCPWRRKITGEIPTQYYYQIQGQLEVCGLDECDYLECEFLEYDNEEEFCRHFHDNKNEKGIIIEKRNSHGGYEYTYSPFALCSNLDALMEWLSIEMTNLEVGGGLPIKTHYWQLHTYSVVRVYKDIEFMQENLPKLKSVWDKIQTYKSDKTLYDEQIANKENEKPKQLRVIHIDDLSSSVSKQNEWDNGTTRKRQLQDNKCGQVSLAGWAFLDDDEI